ncbi:MAG: hypothetical protein WBD45_22755 [Terriglobales bacterium]
MDWVDLLIRVLQSLFIYKRSGANVSEVEKPEIDNPLSLVVLRAILINPNTGEGLENVVQRFRERYVI